MFFYVWVALEATWNVSLFSFCYKFMPLTRWVNASRAKSMRDRLPAYARNLLVNRYNRPPGGPGSKKGTLGQRRWAIATWQWFVLNKLGAVVTIPGKLAWWVVATRYINEGERRLFRIPFAPSGLPTGRYVKIAK